MGIVFRTIRFAKVQLQKRASKMRRATFVFGILAVTLFVFLSPAMRRGDWSGATLAQSPQGQEDSVVIKVGSEVYTESTFLELVDALSSPIMCVDGAAIRERTLHEMAGQMKEDAMPLAVLLALAQKAEGDHIDISKELNEWTKRKRIELLANAELRKMDNSESAIRDFASKAPVWVNNDLLSQRAEAQAGEEARGVRYIQYVGVRTPWEQVASALAHSVQPRAVQPLQAQTPEEAINSIRNGPHAAMPPAQTTGNIAGSGTWLAITNNTPYTLWVYVTGPTSQTIQIAAHGAQSVSLTPGSYQVGAKVSDASILPFYGEHNYGPATQYSETFYISTKP
jgi:hypothetical protein